MKAVPRELVGRYVLPDIPRLGCLNKQSMDQVMEPAVRLSDVVAAMHQRRQIGAVDLVGEAQRHQLVAAADGQTRDAGCTSAGCRLRAGRSVRQLTEVLGPYWSATASGVTTTMVADFEDARRTEPAFVAHKRTMLEPWLEFHRTTLLLKCEGPDRAGLVAASASMTPGCGTATSARSAGSTFI